MCGIVGDVRDMRSDSEDALERATGGLTHRGPRTERTWLSADRRVGLGHARLSIIDLATGDQPIASEDERLRIVVNGEFYDFERIQARPGARGATASAPAPTARSPCTSTRTTAPTACEHLRGEFAFALWDGRDDTLFAARDRFGIKPLFYARHGGMLYLASEVKALFAAGVPARWDRAAFFQAVHHYVAAAGPHAVRGRLPGAARPLPARHGRPGPAGPLLGLRLPGGRRGPGRPAPTPSTPSGSATRSTRRSGCGCGPTCRSAATSAAGSTPAPCWAWRRRTTPARSGPSP